MAQTNINIRIDASTKKRAEEVFVELGMNMTTAINIFLKQCIKCNGIPFNVSNVPNEETLKAIKLAQDDKNMNGPFDNVEDLMKSLNVKD